MRVSLFSLPPVIVLLLVPAHLILHNLNFYRTLLFYKDAYLLFACWLLIPFLLFYILKWLMPAPALAFQLSMVLAIAFFNFSVLQDLLLSYHATAFLSKTYVLLPIISIICIWLIMKRPRLSRFFQYLAFVFAASVLYEGMRLCLNLIHFSQVPKLQTLRLQPETAKNTPNVYHFLFDGYTSSNMLLQHFGFANTADSFLKAHGFYIAANGTTNYNFTPFSIAATLNMQYLPLSPAFLPQTSKNFFIGNALYNNNEIYRFFKNTGYSITHFSLLDDYVHLQGIGTFVPRTPAYALQNQAAQRIWLNPWLRQKLMHPHTRELPPAIQKNIAYYLAYNDSALQKALKQPGTEPECRFIHFLLPHEPYVYDAGGKPEINLTQLSNHASGYVMQLRYANKILMQIANKLQQDSRKKIIIIQGDHSFRNYDGAGSLAKEFQTLNAVYFPDHQYDAVQQHQSTVNTYRIILNQYFHQQLQLLPDSMVVPRL